MGQPLHRRDAVLSLFAAVVILQHNAVLLVVGGFTTFSAQPTATATWTTSTKQLQSAMTKRITTTLGMAKAAKTSPKPSVKRRSGGGFGAPPLPPVKQNVVDPTTTSDDFAIFPALEQRVRDTLVAAESATTGMTEEIYQRLDQIYGLPFFNYESPLLKQQLPQQTSEESWGDLLSDTISPSTELVLEDMVAPAVGEDVATTTSKSKPKASPIIDHNGLSQHLRQLSAIDHQHLRVLHVDPLVLAIDNFFTSDECDAYIERSLQSKSKDNRNVMQSRSPTVGKDANARAQRTSTTYYHLFSSVPELVSKASRLLGLSTIDHWEEPQTVRYRPNEKFTWHLDALGQAEQEQQPAGQRIATLLVYLTDVPRASGGATLFRDLGGGGNRKNSSNDDNINPEPYLRVQPVRGMALLFFPAAGGILPACPIDVRTLHCGEAVRANNNDDPYSNHTGKWIAQLWLRQRSYCPTAPPGNRHGDATPAVASYCASKGVSTSN